MLTRDNLSAMFEAELGDNDLSDVTPVTDLPEDTTNEAYIAVEQARPVLEELDDAPEFVVEADEGGVIVVGEAHAVMIGPDGSMVLREGVGDDPAPDDDADMLDLDNDDVWDDDDDEEDLDDDDDLDDTTFGGDLDDDDDAPFEGVLLGGITGIMPQLTEDRWQDAAQQAHDAIAKAIDDGVDDYDSIKGLVQQFEDAYNSANYPIAVLLAEQVATAIGLTEASGKCPNCGEPFGDDEDNCEECGWSSGDPEEAATGKCPKCKEELNDDGACDECGWSPDDDNDDEADEVERESLSEGRGRRMPPKKSGASRGRNQHGGRGRRTPLAPAKGPEVEDPKLPKDVGGAWAAREGHTLIVLPKDRLQEFVTLAKQAGVAEGEQVEMHEEGDYVGVELTDAVAEKIEPLFDGDDVEYRAAQPA